MAKRRQRRAQPSFESRGPDRPPARTSLRALVLIAVVGLILLSMASLGTVAGPAPSPTPLF
jgi:hypothetical protein